MPTLIVPHTSASAGTTPQYSEDRISWSVFAVPLNYGQGAQTLQLTAIESWSTTKGDASDAGTFQFTGPLADPNNRSYRGVGGPMDLIAIYATRASLDGQQGALDATPLPTQLPNVTGWGNAKGLGVEPFFTHPTLVFVGMVNHITENYSFDEGGNFSLVVDGVDLTKIFIDNEIVIPFGVGDEAAFTTLQSTTLDANSSVQNVLVNLFDAFISRAPNPAGLNGVPIVPGGSQTLGQLSFPWRNFVSIDRLLNKTTPYMPFAAGNDLTFPQFTVHTGSVWASAVELKNEPQGRLFVSEDGELVLDDNLDALIGQAPIAQGITLNDILQVQLQQGDDNVATFISVYGSQVAQGGTGQALTGGIGASGNFTPGGITPQYPSNALAVSSYGIRSATFAAMFDTFIPLSTGGVSKARQRLFNLLQLIHNQMDVMTITVKGQAYYRVGTRVRVGFQNTIRQSVSNAYWYIQQVQHQCDMNQGWTTTLTLRFPQST